MSRSIAEISCEIYEVASSLEGMVNGFEFAKAVVLYWKAYREDDAALKSNVLRWLRPCPFVPANRRSGDRSASTTVNPFAVA